MKVLYLTDSLSDLDGVGNYTYRLLASLEELDPELKVEVLLARKHRPTSDQVPKHWKLEVALPPDYFFYMPRSRYWIWLILGTYRTWRAAKGADLIHAIKDYPHNLVGYLAAHLRGIPCVATAHGTYTVQPLISKRHQKMARWVYKRFAAMISVSNYTRRRLVELMQPFGFDADKVHVVPNCVDPGPYQIARDTGPSAWAGKRFTLGIGEVKERKGHHLSLAAFCELAPKFPDLHHFVVGRLSKDDYQNSLEAKVAEHGLQDRVHFLGNIEEEQKIELLQRAEVFIHTPVTAADGGFEGFGIVYLEASASSTPVIGTLDCGAEDAIVDGETGFLVEQKVPAIRDALEKLLSDSDLCRSMGERGKQHAMQSKWDSNAKRVHGLYLEALRQAK